MLQQMQDIYLPFDAEIIKRVQEAPDIVTLTLKLRDPQKRQDYQFLPGQFNMLYLFGVGEVAISTVSSQEKDLFTHTIRRLGRVTHGLCSLQEGEYVGVRGPFGHGWPLSQAQGKDVLIITGGLGCAPSVSIIHHIVEHRKKFGNLTILQGVKHSDDLIFRKQYAAWAKLPNTEVMLAADVSKPNWPGYTGLITELIDRIKIDIANTICMMCGPEIMMRKACEQLLAMNLAEDNIYLSLERNMECAIGHCGHCQFGGEFICKDGPIFCYSKIKHLLGKKGF